MIVRMKKITLLTSENAKDSFLKELRRLGTLHIENITKPISEDLQEAEEAALEANEAISILTSHEEGSEKHQKPTKIDDAKRHAKEIVLLSSKKKELLDEVESIKGHIDWFKPWGGFNPEDVKTLNEKGIYIKLYKGNKAPYRNLKDREDIKLISEDKQNVFLALISRKRDNRLDFEEISYPDKSLEYYIKTTEKLNSEIDKINYKIKEKVPYKNLLKEYHKSAGKKVTFLNAFHGMQKENGFAYLQGFCPAENVKEIAKLAKNKGAGFLIDDPTEPEKAPTLIKNPKWISIIKPVFKFMSIIPGYAEYDISLWFLMFFSVFFAMLIADGGYGLLFVIITFLARLKFKKAPFEPFFLMYVLGVSTIIWGAMTGTWFGVEKIGELPILKLFVIQNISGFSASNQNFMIYVCFIIGVVHLTIAHLILVIRKINTLYVLAEAGWLLVLWGLFFTAGTLVINKPFPEFAKYFLAIGSILVILFSNPQKNILKGIVTSLANVPLKIIGTFGDIVSYIRLFAVGYASTVLAVTFNNMAHEVGFNNVISGFLAALVLFVGHALNITLGFMAVIVHGIRLNMLEFSGQMGMEWSGSEYKPFSDEK